MSFFSERTKKSLDYIALRLNSFNGLSGKTVFNHPPHCIHHVQNGINVCVEEKDFRIEQNEGVRTYEGGKQHEMKTTTSEASSCGFAKNLDITHFP